MNLHTPWYASKFIKLTFITPNTLYNSKVVPGNMSFFRLIDSGTKTILNDIVENSSKIQTKVFSHINKLNKHMYR